MKLSDVAIKRPVFTTMVMLGLFVFGCISFRSLGVDLFPRVEFPVVTVLSILPGADPHTVETTVSKPIEDALSSISSIKHIRSTSADSVSQVVIQFELEKSADIAFQEVQAKLGSTRSLLPDDLEDPVVEKFDVDSSPIMAVVVSGELPVLELSKLADKQVKNRLQRVPGVGQIRLVGNREKTVWVYLDPYRLEGWNLSVQEVAAAIRAHHIEMPGGRIETSDREIMVRTLAEVDAVSELNNLVIAYRNEAPIFLSDVGSVVDGLEEERSMARLDARGAVALLVQRQSGQNTVAVANAVKNELLALKAELAPLHVSIEVAQDLSVYIEHSIHEIQFHLVLGGILAVCIVFLFLRNVSATIITALAIPLSVIATFIVMYLLNFTMNTLSMLALSLAIGILIDDAIVVIENIFRHFRRLNNPQEASRVGTNEIGLAALAITLSIVAVFVPVAFMKGMVGRFMYQFGLTMTAAVLMSLFVAFTLTPMLSSRFLRQQEVPLHWVGSCLHTLDIWYEKLLRLVLRHKAKTLICAGISLVLALALSGYIRSEFLPQEDQSDFNIKVKTPLGSSLHATDQILSKISDRLRQEPWLSYTFSTIGTDNLRKVNEGMIYVKMVDKHLRPVSQLAAMEQVRTMIGDNPECQVSIEQVPRTSSGSRRACALQVDIKGQDLAKLEAIAKELISNLKRRPGYVDMDLSYDAGKPEVHVAIRREQAAALGVTPGVIASTVSSLVAGKDVAKYTENGDRHDIKVRLQDEFRKGADDLFRMQVRSQTGELIPLSNLIDVTTTVGPVQIDRDNRERIVSVFINLVRSEKTLGQAVSEIGTMLSEMHLPVGYGYEFTGMADVMKESFQSLIIALLLAILLVYMVLASQFESLFQPLVIMLSLPFSIVGALGGLLIADATLNINTMIGIILLMGLVTKNAILLVDYTNTLRASGLPLIDALIEAGKTRLHPILMTTLAMIFGMLPIALSHAAGSESSSPMAIATIGGLITSTFLTLLVVPVVYSISEKIRDRKGRGDAVPSYP